MKGKRPLAVLMVAVLTIGIVGMFAAAPVAAGGEDGTDGTEVGTDDDDNENECEAEASNEANQGQTAVGAIIDQDQFANQNAEAWIENNAAINQLNDLDSTQQATGGNVAQSSDQAASNSAYVSQCEANQNA